MSGLYIHIPFCLSKCAYCAFVSYPVKNFDPASYLKALYLEIDFQSGKYNGEHFSSIFIGGGTPTILSNKDLTELFAKIRTRFSISPDAEITIETNPNTIDKVNASTLRKLGVNRLSIGIQSLNDHTLKLINRTHTADEGRAAVEIARDAGFDNINLDLIYGLPEQDPSQWTETLEEALSLKPEHLAAYQLSIDQGSKFADQVENREIKLPDEFQEAEMHEDTARIMAPSSLEQYEISNYAKPGKRCRHNLLYWHNEEYLGLGAGAVTFRSGSRTSNTPDPILYEERLLAGKLPAQESENLPSEAAFRETVIMGLRLIEGVDLDRLAERYNIDARKYYGATLDKLLAGNLVEINNNRLRLTGTALPFANQVLSELV